MADYLKHESSRYLYNLYLSLKNSDTNNNIKTYLTIDNENNYNNMKQTVNEWLQDKNQIEGIRIIIIQSDGSVSYDSNVSNNNIYQNINKPRPDFLTTGRYLININHGVRHYFQQAISSDDGIFYAEKYSNSVNKNLLYLSLREGLNKNIAKGVIVITVSDKYKYKMYEYTKSKFYLF